MKFNTYILPAHWASALINGDVTGMTDGEERELEQWLDLALPGWCIGCSEEAFFSHTNDADTLAGDCLEFTFQKVES